MDRRAPRAIISAFIAFNIAAILFGSNAPPAEQNVVQRFFYPYLVRTRLLQSWRLFTPSPRKYTLNYRAEITFKDGTSTTWRRPYPTNWDFFGRHLAYHFQKWDLASNYLDTPGLKHLLWSDLGSYLQKTYWSEANPPKSIRFIRSSAEIPPPNEKGDVGLDHDPAQLKWVESVAYLYTVPERGSP